MTSFKTLAEARGAYETLSAQLADMQQQTARLAPLEALVAESKALGETATAENAQSKLLIGQKDQEIAGLKAEKTTLETRVSELKTEVETLKKNQKTVKTEARELVAASGGSPMSVDQAEVARMQAGDEKEFVARMAKEHDPAVLSNLYSEYNRLFRANGKQKK